MFTKTKTSNQHPRMASCKDFVKLPSGRLSYNSSCTVKHEPN